MNDKKLVILISIEFNGEIQEKALNLEITSIPEEKNNNYVEIDLDHDTFLQTKVYKNSSNLFQLKKNNRNDNLFVVELSPCNLNEITFDILNTKNSSFSKESVRKIDKYISYGRYYSMFESEEWKYNYLKVSTELNSFDEFACKFDFYKNKKEQCNLEADGGSKYWIRYYSTDKNYYTWNLIPNGGKHSYIKF